MKKDLKISLILTILGFIAGILTFYYQLNTLNIGMLGQSSSLPTGVLAIITGLEIAAITFVLSFLGIKLARKTNLKLPFLDVLVGNEYVLLLSKNGLIQSVVFAFIIAFIFIASDKFYFIKHIQALSDATVKTSFLYLLTGIFYGGTVEEVLLRLFLMSLLVWILYKIFARKKSKIPSWIYVLSIIFTSLLFALGHIPVTQTLFGELNTIILVRCLLMNGIGGLGFGYLYWKKGPEYSMLSHMLAHVFMQLCFIPILF